MARIAGVDLPETKPIVVALTYLYGIGLSLSRRLLARAGIPEGVRTRDLTEEQLSAIREAIEKGFEVEGALRRRVQSNIKRLEEIASYRGSRHRKKLPVRGQRTKTNARTKRGKRITVGGMKKKLEKT